MILILSNNGDLSADYVSDWLRYFNHPFIRINSDDFLTSDVIFSLDNNSTELKFNSQPLCIDNINSVWFRKFGDFSNTVCYNFLIDNKFDYEIIELLQAEFRRTISTILLMLHNKKWLTKYTSTGLNKILMLKKAAECGLYIPKTFIINRKKFLKNGENYISKSLVDPINIIIDENKYGFMYTSKVGNDNISNLPDYFSSSLIQEEIVKNYEIRVFYICGEVFPMAIFSQKDSQTIVDFRQYNDICPNRFVPCKLSDAEIKKIDQFMRKIDLNCGSLDFIRTKDGQLVFLEVNPTGQFGMVDFPCNYGLHKKVAETLIKMDVK